MLTLKTAPTSEPVTLAEAKDHLRISNTDSDTLITALIAVARQRCEEFTHRAFITQTWQYALDAVPVPNDYVPWSLSQLGYCINVPRPNLISVASITTYDTDNNGVVYSSVGYVLDVISNPGRIFLNKGYSWPGNVRDINAMVIEYTAGYGAASAVHEQIKTAIKMTVASLFEHRGDDNMDLPDVVKQLLAPYVIRLV